MTRHVKENHFSLSLVKVGDKEISVNSSSWTDTTPEGLANFMKQNVPNWTQLLLTKNTFVIDTEKRQGSNIVAQKQTVLKIGRIGDKSLCTRVDENMQRNGRVPSNIACFFGGNQKQKG